jgi:hypothetical protein
MDNVLVNYAPSYQNESRQRFTDVQVCDLESTVHVSSRYCTDRDEIGTPIWRSPEAQLGLQWGPPTDIWSFGTMVAIARPRSSLFITYPYVDILTMYKDHIHDLGRQLLHLQAQSPSRSR